MHLVQRLLVKVSRQENEIRDAQESFFSYPTLWGGKVFTHHAFVPFSNGTNLPYSYGMNVPFPKKGRLSGPDSKQNHPGRLGHPVWFHLCPLPAFLEPVPVLES